MKHINICLSLLQNYLVLALDPENNKELEKTWTTPGIFLAKDISIGSTSWDFLRVSNCTTETVNNFRSLLDISIWLRFIGQ